MLVSSMIVGSIAINFGLDMVTSSSHKTYDMM